MKCAVCGKEFDVLYQTLWRYKRGAPEHVVAWLCSWSCLREYDRRKEAKGSMVILNEEQKKKAAEMALQGGDVRGYLKGLGCANPTTSWQTVLRWAEKNLPKGEAKKLPLKISAKPAEKPKVILQYDESIREEYRKEQEAMAAAVEQPQPEREWIPAAEVYGEPEKPAEEKWEVTAIRSEEWGEFYFDEKHRCIDWRHPGGEEVSLPLADWVRLPEVIPQILKMLGVG